MHHPARRARLGIGVLVVLASAAGCGSDDTATARPAVDVALSDTSITLPSQIAGGLVDLHLEAADGDVSHHLAIFRLEHGVTYDQAINAPDEEFDHLVTWQGGNGDLAPGHQATLTFDLPPGRYLLFDFTPDGDASRQARTTVTASSQHGSAPRTDTTITLGPGHTIRLPVGFDGSGTWRVDNTDTKVGEAHEATLVRLLPGKTIQDLIAWASTFEGPMPFELAGGMGALGPGLHGWVDDAPALDPGSYVVACFLPGSGGQLHAATGMATAFSVPQT